jgi:hypothetical protein
LDEFKEKKASNHVYIDIWDSFGDKEVLKL